MEQETPCLKVVFVGDSGVGKTAIAQRFVNGVFNPQTAATVGVGILKKEVIVNGKTVQLNLWDTAGQEEFRALTTNYYRDASIVIIVFAVGNCAPDRNISPSSFESVREWYAQVTKANEKALICLVGNMSDLSERKVTYDQGEELADELSDVSYYETSALSGEGIEDLFESSSRDYLKKIDQTISPPQPPQPVPVQPSERKKCC
ncbi:Ras-related protein SEC4 [Histomonas meleagridis]|uniref:Ras-related protein SEC4 n=1 Tax=Histomonas meleagridis TaxID=135588 RepID=UPI0035595F5F|nr:Ras-related protein SEC4 [Histomonas meleagridis]KAH0807150.1 Ras-related protein SEC4 [Histomonas meleagridis]